MRTYNLEMPPERRILFRIGVNLGDVIEQDGDLLGDSVNVAARLEALAEARGVCLSRAAHDQVRDRLDIAYEDLGEVEVKDIARPVGAFRVRCTGEPPPPLTSAVSQNRKSSVGTGPELPVRFEACLRRPSG